MGGPEIFRVQEWMEHPKVSGERAGGRNSQVLGAGFRGRTFRVSFLGVSGSEWEC